MDIVTQAILGATLTQTVAKKTHIRLATIVGLIAGVIADVDIFIRSESDPLLSLEFHRHFTHSVFFIPFGAGLVFLLFWPFLRNKLSAAYLFLYCFMGYLLSGFIDACTSYGTNLFWPLNSIRVSWHIISVVDPLFTLILIVAIITGYKNNSSVFSRIGILLAGSYLLFTFSQMNHAENLIKELAAKRDHTIEKIIIKPTIGNALLWRSVYLSNETFYVDAVRVGLSKRIYQGGTIKKFDMKKKYPELDVNSQLAKDIKRFGKFSDNYVSQYPGKPNLLGDIRYSILPTGTTPLWAIEMDLDNTNEHVKLINYRNMSKEVKQQFFDMLLGKSINE
ncbi:MAG: hydrolase [Legionellales bacterium]|nr:hydrolase [Legionellales bacterium]|tara:strand:+ start:568 stop:1572 length:1005 start_codon:yes stop_codon:yes gene_type:complete